MVKAAAAMPVRLIDLRNVGAAFEPLTVWPSKVKTELTLAGVRNDFENVKDVVERELGYGPYLFGAQFTAADVMIGSMFVWLRMWGKTVGRHKIDAYVDRLLARPKGMRFS